MRESNKIHTFKDVIVWQKSIFLSKKVYALTQSFPSVERFGLVDQMRRSSTSISSNFAEGFRRKDIKVRLHFYDIAKGSLNELRSQLALAHNIGYVSLNEYQTAEQLAEEVSKLLYGWKKKENY